MQEKPNMLLIIIMELKNIKMIVHFMTQIFLKIRNILILLLKSYYQKVIRKREYNGKKYNIKRIEDRNRLIEKYINNVKVKRLGKNEYNKEEYELNIQLNLKDEKLLVNEGNKLINKNKEYKVYISNIKDMELSDLMYKDILSIDIVVLLDLSWKYIDYKKVIIDDVR